VYSIESRAGCGRGCPCKRVLVLKQHNKKGRVHVGWAIKLDMGIGNVWRARMMTTCLPAGKSLDETGDDQGQPASKQDPAAKQSMD
jgi:hypothetical protein